MKEVEGMIKTREEVEAFLRLFKLKLDVWGIFFIYREKNAQALITLGITPKAREEIIRKIESADYVETLKSNMAFGEMWIFGKNFSGTELYIKIALGAKESSPICISFHTAEYPVKYVFK